MLFSQVIIISFGQGHSRHRHQALYRSLIKAQVQPRKNNSFTPFQNHMYTSPTQEADSPKPRKSTVPSLTTHHFIYMPNVMLIDDPSLSASKLCGEKKNPIRSELMRPVAYFTQGTWQLAWFNFTQLFN